MIRVVKGDITKITNVQAIVNAANSSLLGGSGVDGAIHKAAGPGLLEECRNLHGCKTGQAKITKGYNLKAEYIIHTVGPVWNGGSKNEAELLASCYENSLKVAVENGIRTIAFPSISTGIYGYPVDKAAKIAVKTANDFLIKHHADIDDITWVLFDDNTYSIYNNEIKKLIDTDDYYINKMISSKETAEAFMQAMDLSNLGIIAPHKMKYFNRYDINWLINSVDLGVDLKYVTFWKVDEENSVFSQWYKGEPFLVNGRQYVTAEQYMMSEKALLFNDLDSYKKIMIESEPSKCKFLGRNVRNFDGDKWNKSFREIIFHGNLGKIQADIKLVDALLRTDNAVLVEASSEDDIYGAGLSKEDLLNSDGTLKVHPRNWHKIDSTKQSENNLGFVLMGIRDLFRELMHTSWRPGEDEIEL